MGKERFVSLLALHNRHLESRKSLNPLTRYIASAQYEAAFLQTLSDITEQSVPDSNIRDTATKIAIAYRDKNYSEATNLVHALVEYYH